MTFAHKLKRVGVGIMSREEEVTININIPKDLISKQTLNALTSCKIEYVAEDDNFVYCRCTVPASCLLDTVCSLCSIFSTLLRCRVRWERDEKGLQIYWDVKSGDRRKEG